MGYSKDYYDRNREKCKKQIRESHLRHRESRLKSQKEYRREHYEEVTTKARAYDRKVNKELKIETLSAYGGVKCAVCGYNKDYRALDLDHINGGGNKERIKTGINGGIKFYNILRKQGFPDKDKYRVLCRNCNWLEYLDNRQLKKAEV
jgi:hypothetical protein